MKHKALLLSSLILLASCSQNNIKPCYQCYLGRMYLSGGTKKEEDISSSLILDKVTSRKNEPHYGESHILIDKEEKQSFYEENPGFPEKEKNNNIECDDIIIQFFVQIPKGYVGFKRNNVQGYIHKDSQIMLTDNLYYYENQNKLFFCDIDIKKEETSISSSVFSFYFAISSDLEDVVRDASIKLIYQLS